ncbi:MAG TPA: hypothetical protein VGL61_17760 [Kofleriaceae bacterium]
MNERVNDPRRDLAIESLGDARRGNVLVQIAIVACIVVPGLVFVKVGPRNFYIELAVGLVFAVIALVLGVALPARVQRKLAAEKLAALHALPGFDVDRYMALLGTSRDGGRLVANVTFAAAPSPESRAKLEQALAGWHLEWEGATLLAETEHLSGVLLLESRFKSSGAPSSVPTNAAFHARLEQLVHAVGDVTKLTVDIVT